MDTYNVAARQIFSIILRQKLKVYPTQRSEGGLKVKSSKFTRRTEVKVGSK
ncbi:MAG: hypothetical protein AB9834_08615 [Lentimicrobium sp.]